MADLDLGKNQLYVGNYDFWKEQIFWAMLNCEDRNAKAEEKLQL